MFSNLYKAGFVHLGEDARVIDMNAILEKRLKEEAERRSRQPEHELVAAQDGFTEGLNAEKVDVLLEPDAEAASQQNASIREQEQLKQEIEEARNELAGLQAQIEQEKEQAQLEIDQMKAKAFEEANEQGYQEGYRKGLDSVQELQKQCEDERLQQEQEYQKKLEEMEPLMVDTLCLQSYFQGGGEGTQGAGFEAFTGYIAEGGWHRFYHCSCGKRRLCLCAGTEGCFARRSRYAERIGGDRFGCSTCTGTVYD